MVHLAYDVKELVKACPVKIESVALWGSRLFIACIDGSLRIYNRSSSGGREEEEEDEEEEEEEEAGDYHNRKSPAAIRKGDAFTLQNTLIGFSKKPVSRIDVLQKKNLLITLSEAVIVHRLPGFDSVAYLTSTKGASLYAWDEKQGLLCAAKQKKLIVFQYNGSRGFLELKELAAPDVVRSMAWCGESLCLGIRREYVILNITTGMAIEIFPCGRIASPLVVPLPSGELLLGKDNMGVFIDQNGKLTQAGGITWSEVPNLVVVNPPYALAWLSRFIEVRYLHSPYSLVQMVPLREMQLLPRDNHFVASGPQVLAVSDYAVHALLLVPLAAQIVQLAASRSFDEALALCKLLPPEDASLRANKEDEIHKRYGHTLFQQQEYEKSMEHFAASSLDVTAVLSLFPSIRRPKICTNSGIDSSLQFPSMEVEQFDASDDNSESPVDVDETEGGLDEDASQEKDESAAMRAFAVFLQAKRAAIIERAEAEETSAAVAAMVNEDGSTKDVRKPKSSLKYSNIGTEKKRSYGARETAVILDTALVQALLFSHQSAAAMQLLTGPNYCEVDACEEMMLQGSYFKELLQLYKYNKLHRKVLDLLNQLAEDKETKAVPSLHIGSEAIIDYLKKLGGQDPHLILNSSTWLLKTCPEQAMSAFTSMDPPLPADDVNMYLKDKFPELQAMYLEHLMKNDKRHFSEALQNELVHIYLCKVLDECSQLQALGTWDEGQHTKTRKELLAVLENWSGYSCESILKRLPTNGLYEERAILLGRLGQHQLALTLYAHKLHEPDLALKYCDRVFSASTTSTIETNESASLKPTNRKISNIYLILLQIYLRPSTAVREYDRSVAGLDFAKKFPSQRIGIAHRTKGHVARKIAQIEGADDYRQNLSSNESTTESSKSDVEDNRQNLSGNENIVEKADQNTELVMLEEALDLLSSRWDRIDGAQALSLLPSNTKLQRLYSFLEPLVRKSSESRRNLSVIKNLRQSENLQVQDELRRCRRRSVKITSESICSICRKRIGNSVFVVYPTGILVHFVCYKDQNNGAAAKPAISSY